MSSGYIKQLCKHKEGGQNYLPSIWKQIKRGNFPGIKGAAAHTCMDCQDLEFISRIFSTGAGGWSGHQLKEHFLENT